MMKKKFVFQTILVLCALIVGAGSAWAQETYVKWKKIEFADLQNGDVVAIVDLTTGLAMTNDKGSDKKPGTVAVELNADKDRIIGSEENNGLPDNILWVVEKEEDVKFHVGDDWLQYDDSKLSVGQEKEGIFKGIDHNCLKTVPMGDPAKIYYVGLKNSMMSKSWEVKAEKEGGGVDDDIKDTQIAIFKKVEDAQQFVSLKFESDNYAVELSNATVEPSITCTGASASDIAWNSSNEGVATVEDGVVSFIKRGTVTITASVSETVDHDKASATCTLIIDDPTDNVPGSKNHPFTVAQAKELAQNGKVNVNDNTVFLEANCNYYIQGIISKVGGGIFDMFGDMEIPGMDDMDFDLDGLGIALPGMGDNGTCSYYISDDGTKDGHMKVIDGHGNVEIVDNALTYSSLSSSDLSPGDKVIVCGPLVYTEDKSMFSGIGGTGGGDSEPQYSAKVDADNYLQDITNVLVVKDITDMKINTTKASEQLYSISNLTAGTAGAPVFKSSDKEVANWVKNEAGTDSTFTALKEGTAKITAKVKVTLQEDDPATDDNEEKSYTMKRKFSVKVTSRDKDPYGLKNGKYVLVTDLSQLEDGNKLLIVGMDGETPDVMKSEDSMMGGKGTEATDFLNVDNEDVIVTVPDGALEITLEKYDDTYWRFRASNNEYLYASDKDAEGSEGGFDIASMFGGGGAKLKFGTEVNQGDSLKATIAIDASGNATIKYKFENREKDTNEGPETVKAKNRIKFGTKLDFNMPGGGGDSDMDFSAIFDSFSMPSFSAYDEDDNTHTLPRIYRFVQYDSYEFTIGEAKWATLVSAYDVTLPDEFKAYVVTDVEDKAITIEQVTTSLKGGIPYLINAPETQGSYKMTQTTGAPEPTTNLLRISDAETSGTSESSNVYVLANKEEGVGFYRWTGGLLGAGRVYLPGDASASSNFLGFDDETTSIGASLIGNGQLIKDNYYDLSGRRIANGQKPTAKGVYIVNGKKVIKR